MTDRWGNLVAHWWVVSDSTGEAESTAKGSPKPGEAEKAKSGGDGLAVGGSQDASTTKGGERVGDEANTNSDLPDLSDISGATTGPMSLPGNGDNPDAPIPWEPAKPAPTGEIDLDADATAKRGSASWAAPAADAIKEPTGSNVTEPTGSNVTEPTEVAPPPPPPSEATVTAAPPTEIVTPSPPPSEATVTAAPPTEIVTPSPPPSDATVKMPVADALSVAVANAATTTLAAPPDPPGGTLPDPTADIAVPSTKASSKASSKASTDGPKGKRSHRGRNSALILLGLLAGFFGVWLIDSARTSDQVVRNTMLGTSSIGGLSSSELDTVIDAKNDELAETAITVSIGETTVGTDPVTLGAVLDRQIIQDKAFEAGRGGSVFMRPLNWIRSFGTTRTIDTTYAIAEGIDADSVPEVIAAALDAPVEPGMTLRGTELAVVPGSEGETIDGAQLLESLPIALAGGSPFIVEIDPVVTTPEFDDQQIRDVIDEASAATANPVIFQVLDKTAEVDFGEIRSWVRLETEGGDADWSLDPEASAEHLKTQFPTLGSEDQMASFTIVDGEPIILPASETVICCDEASIGNIRGSLTAIAPAEVDDSSDDPEEAVQQIISLEPEIVGSDEGVAELESLGIVEEVSTFTTNHACCANRVINIQRFADLMRGVVIRPGEDFSLNGHVGRRTIENGFAADGAIANGILEPQVGGGISQFATTFFNASFFAGIEFNEYQSHSLYISRYPRGREATISFPRPDLSVKNTTPYGILVWTEYTPTSITVTFYSTKYVEVEALSLQSSSQQECTRYTTPRVRTYLDGTVEQDSVFAVYRPGEGLNCRGESTRPEEDEPAGPPQPEPDGPDGSEGPVTPEEPATPEPSESETPDP